MNLHVAKIKSRAVTRLAASKYDVTNIKNCSNSFGKPYFNLNFSETFVYFQTK